MADTAKQSENKAAINEGADVYGSDGEQWGRVEAVGAKYLKIAEGLLGQKEWYLPIGLVSCGDADRVELSVPLAEAKAQASKDEPRDEPTLTGSAPIAPEEMEAVGIPEPARAEVGTGEGRDGR